MKKTLFAGAFAAFALTPALAQQTYVEAAPVGPTGQVIVGVQPEWAAGYPYAAQQFGLYPQAGTYAYVTESAPATGFEASPFGRLAVSIDGKIIGADPDPSIVSELQRNQDMMLGRGSS